MFVAIAKKILYGLYGLFIQHSDDVYNFEKCIHIILHYITLHYIILYVLSRSLRSASDQRIVVPS